MDVIEIGSSDSEAEFDDEDDEIGDMQDYTGTEKQSSGPFGVAREGFSSRSCNTHRHVLEQPVASSSGFHIASSNQNTDRSVPSSQNHHSTMTVQASLGAHSGSTFNSNWKNDTILDDDWESESTSYALDWLDGEGKSEQDASKRLFPSSSQHSVKLDGKTPSKVPAESKSKGNLDLRSSDCHGSASTCSNGKLNVDSSGEDLILIESNGSTSSAERRVDICAHVTSVSTYRMLPSSLHSADNEHLGHGEDGRITLQNIKERKLEDDIPDGLLTVPLLKHQKLALTWMVKRENRTVCAGGILADDQGLGKTISMIALIQKQKFEQSRHASGDSNGKKPKASNIRDDHNELYQLNDRKCQRCSDTKYDMVESATKISKLAGEKMPNGADDNRLVTIARKLKRASDDSRSAGGTLIVCPASVLRQWARELDEKVPYDAKLSVLVYHGGTRTKQPTDLTKYDIVLTTYAIVANEVPKLSTDDDDDVDQKFAGFCQDLNNKRKQSKRKMLDDSNLGIAGGALARVWWFRVILDEVQTIKNHRTRVARACCSLRAKRRWCLSGTPIQNAIDDLYSYFRFLKFEPYDNYNKFDLLLKIPISKNAVEGYKKLQAVLKTMLLRRTKGTIIDGEPILKLPPKSISLERIKFSKEEGEFYSRLEADARRQFKEFDDAGTVQQNYANILVLLLRLRQACNHPFLVNNGTHSDMISKDSLGMAKQLPMDMLINLLNELEGSFAICGVCSDPPEDAVVTMCSHVFCYQCVSNRLIGEDNSCPAPGCKEVVGADLVFSKSTLRSCISGTSYTNASTSSFASEDCLICNGSFVSSKIRAAIDILKQLRGSSSGVDQNIIGSEYSPVRTHSHFMAGSSSDAHERVSRVTKVPVHVGSVSKSDIPAKAIVFSQWTGMLDLLESFLNQELIQYRRLDGSMPLGLRDKAVKDFNTDAEVVVMLMSLKAGSLGLNMVAACHVILLDMWWNPTTEDQAIDRAHRIGQTRPVTVSRLTIRDTVEDRILTLQEEKKKMVASCFGEETDGNLATRLTVADLRFLFFG